MYVLNRDDFLLNRMHSLTLFIVQIELNIPNHAEHTFAIYQLFTFNIVGSKCLNCCFAKIQLWFDWNLWGSLENEPRNH